MQRICIKFRSLTLQLRSAQTLSSSRSLLHSSSPILQPFRPFSSPSKWGSNPLFDNPSSQTTRRCCPLNPSPLPLSLVQVRHVSSRERKKRRKPMTPVTSKVKKTKMKSYSSYKSRFRTLNDGTIRCWHGGKNHNAHLKSKKSKRRLRQPAVVPAAYAKVMKKLNFCG